MAMLVVAAHQQHGSAWFLLWRQEPVLYENFLATTGENRGTGAWGKHQGIRAMTWATAAVNFLA